ncbi:MAG: TraR/DksA family transcriptional regulator [Planctomycetota bacterium]|nr:MAG: TraR/DksA family transcriptional regulator [Planctomycetota bacterium]
MTTRQAQPRNGKRAIHPEDLQEMEELLMRRKAFLAHDVLGLERALTDPSEEDLRLARMESAGEEINEIEEALHRIHEGMFGSCEGCGDPITVERLRAIPYARLCLACKQAEESP